MWDEPDFLPLHANESDNSSSVVSFSRLVRSSL